MRALIRFDCFGVIFMTMFFTPLCVPWNLIALSLSPNSVPAPESHRSVASLRRRKLCFAHFRAMHEKFAHSVAPPLPDCRGKVISHSDRYSVFKVQWKSLFTYSHWEAASDNLKRKNICKFENPSHLFAQRVSKCTPVFWLSPENFLENLSLHLFPLGKAKCTP